jgi:hypothetical protein
MRPFATSRLLVLALFLAPVLPPPAGAEFLEQRLRANLVPIIYGPGTTRLDGMGLQLAARDENNEINLFDYGDNPAGLLADRDAWSLDFRASHRERLEKNPDLPGFDYRGNSYSFLAGYRRTGVHAIGGGIDYFDSTVRERNTTPTVFKNTQYRLLYNRMFDRLGVGLEFRYANESENLINSTELYSIEHGTDAYTGLLGVSYSVNEFITVAGRGDLRRAGITGESRSDAHLDTYDWDRPSGGLEGQVFVHHPRVQGAVSLGKSDGAGEENVQVGWSPLFVFNPSNTFVRFEKRVLTETRDASRFRTRWDYDVLPGSATLSASYNREKTEAEVRTIPIVTASLDRLQEEFEVSDLGVGASLLLFEQRLFLGGELHRQEQSYLDRDDQLGFTQDLNVNSLNIGAEYLVLETFAARAGFGLRTEDRADTRDPGETSGATGSETATTASLGVGLVPSGGILQLDAAYSADVSSGWDIDQSQFSLYARLLF